MKETIEIEWPRPGRDWRNPRLVRAFLTTRKPPPGGRAPFNLSFKVCRSAAQTAATRANRRALRALLPQEPRWLSQAHGAVVVRADSVADDDAPAADAAWTDATGVVCAATVADCLPVFFRCQNAVAIAHAGWRGLAAGVLENTARALRENARGEIVAHVGAGTGRARYEVGADVKSALGGDGFDYCFVLAPFVDKEPKFFADLKSIAARRLRAVGIEAVSISPLDTLDETESLFSARRAARAKNGDDGRMVAVIFLP